MESRMASEGAWPLKYLYLLEHVGERGDNVQFVQVELSIDFLPYLKSCNPLST